MSKYVIDSETLTSIGNAVRNKGKTQDKIKVSELANTINNLPMEKFFEQYMARTFTEFESDTTYPIRYGMFRTQSQLVRVNFPNTTGVENEAFRFCAKLEEADLPKAEQFDAYAFAGCSKLTRLNVPSLRIMRGNTLNQCTSLKDFPYFENIEEIGGYEFRQCPIEQKVWDFKNLTKIGAQYSFSEASAEVIICRKALTRQDRIFHGVPNLKVVDLHTAFTIGRYAFQNSPNMEALILRDTENLFGCLNQDVLTSNTNYYVYAPATLLESYKSATNWSVAPERFRPLSLERLAWYAPSKIMFLDSECNTETGHVDGVTELFDLSKNGYNATINGTLTYDDGYVFDGNAENYLTVPSTPVLDSAEELTYEMIWDLANVSGTQRLLFSSSLQMYINGGSFKCDLNFDGTPKEQPSVTATTGLVSLAVVFKANEYQKLFANGVEVATFDAVANTANAPTFYIGQGSGQYPVASGNKFLAFRAYNRALTTEEIANNYQLDKERWGQQEAF